MCKLCNSFERDKKYISMKDTFGPGRDVIATVIESYGYGVFLYCSNFNKTSYIRITGIISI